MYTPKGWHWIGPVGTVLTGFLINQQVLGGGFHWDYFVTVQLPLAAVASEWGAYIWQAGVVYQKFLTGMDVKTDAPAVTATRVVPPIFVDGKEVSKVQEMQTTVDMPLLSSERTVAKTLITQRNSNLPVVLTETYWIKGNHFPDGQLKFRAMLRKWQFNSAIAKGISKTATYGVTDWRKIRLVSEGHALPPPPPNWTPWGEKS
jgi:hypothetical protein